MVAVCASAHAATRTVVAVSDLDELGIAAELMQLSTPMASVEIGALVKPINAPGEYQFTECVILTHKLSEEKLADSDAESSEVLRRNKSVKERSIFLVRGREVAQSYLAFQFSVHIGGATEIHRYLLPIARLRDEGY